MAHIADMLERQEEAARLWIAKARPAETSVAKQALADIRRDRRALDFIEERAMERATWGVLRVDEPATAVTTVTSPPPDRPTAKASDPNRKSRPSTFMRLFATMQATAVRGFCAIGYRELCLQSGVAKGSFGFAVYELEKRNLIVVHKGGKFRGDRTKYLIVGAYMPPSVFTPPPGHVRLVGQRSALFSQRHAQLPAIYRPRKAWHREDPEIVIDMRVPAKPGVAIPFGEPRGLIVRAPPERPPVDRDIQAGAYVGREVGRLAGHDKIPVVSDEDFDRLPRVNRTGGATRRFRGYTPDAR